MAALAGSRIALVGCATTRVVDEGQVEVFACGEACRAQLKAARLDMRVAVGASVPDVAPENLVAALKKDCPQREVVAVCSREQAQLGLRMVEAGAARTISLEQLDQMLDQLMGASPAASHAPVAKTGVTQGTRAVCLALLSGRGGVGKSTLSALFALAARSLGLKVLLIDMDTQFGDLRFICGKDSAFQPLGIGIGCDVGALGLQEVPEGRTPLVFASENPEYSQELARTFSQVLAQATGLADVVVVNTGTHWTEAHADVLELCDAAVFVMDQRPTSVQGCRRARDLCMRMGVPSSKVLYLLNRCSAKGRLSALDCSLSLGVEQVFEVEDGGTEVEELLDLGKPSALFEGQNAAALSITRAFEQMVARFGVHVGGGDVPAAKKRSPWPFRKGRSNDDVVAR